MFLYCKFITEFQSERILKIGQYNGEVTCESGWLCSRVVSVLDSSAEGLWLQIAAVLSKLFTPIVPLFIKQQNWYQADCQEPGLAPEP